MKLYLIKVWCSIEGNEQFILASCKTEVINKLSSHGFSSSDALKVLDGEKVEEYVQFYTSDVKRYAKLLDSTTLFQDNNTAELMNDLD